MIKEFLSGGQGVEQVESEKDEKMKIEDKDFDGILSLVIDDLKEGITDISQLKMEADKGEQKIVGAELAERKQKLKKLNEYKNSFTNLLNKSSGAEGEDKKQLQERIEKLKENAMGFIGEEEMAERLEDVLSQKKTEKQNQEKIFVEQAVKAESFDDFAAVLEKSGRDNVERLIDNIGIYQEYGHDETLNHIRGDHIIRECDLDGKVDEWAEELKNKPVEKAGEAVESLVETPARGVSNEVIEIEEEIKDEREKMLTELMEGLDDVIGKLEILKDGDTDDSDTVKKMTLATEDFYEKKSQLMKLKDELADGDKQDEVIAKINKGVSPYTEIRKKLKEIERAKEMKGEINETEKGFDSVMEGLSKRLGKIKEEAETDKKSEMIEGFRLDIKRIRDDLFYNDKVKENLDEDLRNKFNERLDELERELDELSKSEVEEPKETGPVAGEVLEGEEISGVETEEEPATVGEEESKISREVLERLERIDDRIEKARRKIEEIEAGKESVKVGREDSEEKEAGDTVKSSLDDLRIVDLKLDKARLEIDKMEIQLESGELSNEEKNKLERAKFELEENKRKLLNEQMKVAEIWERKLKGALLHREYKVEEAEKKIGGEKKDILKKLTFGLLGGKAVETEAPSVDTDTTGKKSGGILSRIKRKILTDWGEVKRKKETVIETPAPPEIPAEDESKEVELEIKDIKDMILVEGHDTDKVKNKEDLLNLLFSLTKYIDSFSVKDRPAGLKIICSDIHNYLRSERPDMRSSAKTVEPQELKEYYKKLIDKIEEIETMQDLEVETPAAGKNLDAESRGESEINPKITEVEKKVIKFISGMNMTVEQVGANFAELKKIKRDDSEYFSDLVERIKNPYMSHIKKYLEESDKELKIKELTVGEIFAGIEKYIIERRK